MIFPNPVNMEKATTLHMSCLCSQGCFRVLQENDFRSSNPEAQHLQCRSRKNSNMHGEGNMLERKNKRQEKNASFALEASLQHIKLHRGIVQFLRIFILQRSTQLMAMAALALALMPSAAVLAKCPAAGLDRNPSAKSEVAWWQGTRCSRSISWSIDCL